MRLIPLSVCVQLPQLAGNLGSARWIGVRVAFCCLGGQPASLINIFPVDEQGLTSNGIRDRAVVDVLFAYVGNLRDRKARGEEQRWWGW